MINIFESISKRLAEAWRSEEPSGRGHRYRCQCGRAIFFRNSLCLGCKSALGYEPEVAQVRAIEPVPDSDTWRLNGQEKNAPLWRRCKNFDSPAGCNWLVPADEEEPLCRSCRLNRTIPNLDDADNCRWWRLIENAKRLLVAQLLGLGLPVKSKVSEDPERGVMFDFVRSPEKGPRILTGHANGLITLNVEEADDSKREKTRHEMREPYRTLLGHFRHEIGHYYWDRLVAGTPWHREISRALRRRAARLRRGAQAELRTGSGARLGGSTHQLLCLRASVGGLGGMLGPLPPRRGQSRHGAGIWFARRGRGSRSGTVLGERSLRPGCSGCKACRIAGELVGTINHGAQRTGAEHGPARLLPLRHVAPSAA